MKKWFLVTYFFIIFITHVFPDIINVGNGSYTDTLPQGEILPQTNIYKTENLKKPVPTNDWWSSLISSQWSFSHYAFPLSFNFEENSMYGVVFTVKYPDNITVATNGLFANHGGTQGMRFRFKKTNGEYLKPLDVTVDNFSDWTVTPVIKDQFSDEYCRITYGHGLPFVYFETSLGVDTIEVEFENPINIFNFSGSTINLSNQTDTDSIAVELSKSNGNNYFGFFASEGSTFQQVVDWLPVISIKLPNTSSQKYLSVGVMTKKEDINFFYNYAYAFVKNTNVSWSYDEKRNEIKTTFTVETEPKRLGQQKTLLALFPHQWKYVENVVFLSQEYTTLRGTMKLIEGNRFEVKHKFNGVLPYLPDFGNYDRNHLISLLNSEKDTLIEVPGNNDDNTYSTAKWMAKVASMIPIADMLDEKEIRDYLINRLKTTLTNWYTYTPGEQEMYFYYDKNWGGLIGYNPAFTSENYTDHHFHYGYFVYASAILSMYDKEFLNDYGGMVELLIRDVASPYKDEELFPFLRCMDPYEGHSWADGFSKFYDGNNQESTSEAMNFWYGVILWGLISGNTTYRDLGIWGYTTEYSSIREYWFDVDKQIFSKYPSYTHHMASLVWGGKVEHNTWFSTQPECIHGIQYIPVTAGSLYLTYDLSWAVDDYNEMLQENNGIENETGWHSIIWKFQAMFDPQSVLSKYQENYLYLNDGDSWSHVYHFVNVFNNIGNVYTDIYADIPSFNVFDKNGTKTYVVYNFDNINKYVNFYERDTNKYIGSLYVSSNSIASSQILEFRDTPPQITTNLISGTTLSGVVDVYINVIDDFEVSKLTIYIDDTKVEEKNILVSSYIYTYSLNTFSYLYGLHKMKCVVIDSSTQENYVETIFFINNSLLFDETPPTVKILQPQNLQTVSSEVYITYFSSDDTKLNKAEIYINDILCYSTSYLNLKTIYSSWIWDTTQFQDGVYNIKIVAYDEEQNQNSDQISVLVSNHNRQLEENNYDYVLRNYPNPFKIGIESTWIKFKTKQKIDNVEAVIYDLSGKIIKVLNIIDKGGNRYLTFWDGRDENSNFTKTGVYICKVKYSNKVLTRKIVGIKQTD